MALTDFILNTDNQIEKVIAFKQGSFSASSFSNTISIAHGLPFTPLPYFQWSLDANFDTPYEISQGYGDLYTPAFPYVTWAYANGTNFIFDIFIDNTYTSLPKTIYYRMYGFEPTNSGGGDVDPTSGLPGLFNFTLNTELNYLRIVDKNRVVVASTSTIPHSLGSRPTVMVWEEVNDFTHGQVTAPTLDNILYDSSGFAPLAATRVNTNSIMFTRAGTYHYRIYA